MRYLAESAIFQWLLASVAFGLAEPNLRAIVQNLAATSLWELARFAPKALRISKPLNDKPTVVEQVRVTNGPERLDAIMLAAISALAKRPGELTMKMQRSKYEKVEVTIKLAGGKRQVIPRFKTVQKRVSRSQRQGSQNGMLFD